MKIAFYGNFPNPVVMDCRRFLCDSLTARFGKRAQVVDGNWSHNESEFDWVLSVLCHDVLSPDVLSCARFGAVNWHPGPPEYPGIGCTNWALYDGVDVYGVTCHLMAPKVDSGNILRVQRFTVLPTDSVLDLTNRTYRYLQSMFEEFVMSTIIGGEPISPAPGEQWKNPPRTRRELNELCRVRPGMSRDEVQRVIRCTTYPGKPGAFIEIGGVRFLPEREEEFA